MGTIMRYSIPIIACLATGTLLLAAPATAGTVWQWTDARGQVHFSDTAPHQSLETEQITYPAKPSAPAAGGLRPGERKRLQLMQQRQRRQLQQASEARRRSDRTTAARRKNCQATREQLHASHDREQRKHHATRLRRHCW